jgi:hypothetical protein
LLVREAVLAKSLPSRPTRGSDHRGGVSTSVLVREAVVMAKDLPNRPKPDKSAPVKKVKATDRVKSKADKVDPRFEAARKRAVLEEERRAKADAARKARADNGEHEGEDKDAGGESSRSGFSFNQFARRTRRDES